MKRWRAVGVCECGVGNKAVPGEEHSQITSFIQQGQTIYIGARSNRHRQALSHAQEAACYTVSSC